MGKCAAFGNEEDFVNKVILVDIGTRDGNRTDGLLAGTDVNARNGVITGGIIADLFAVHIKRDGVGVKIDLHGEVERTVLGFDAGIGAVHVVLAVLGGKSSNIVEIIVYQFEVNAVLNACD